MTELLLRPEWVIDPYGINAALAERRRLRQSGWIRRRK